MEVDRRRRIEDADPLAVWMAFPSPPMPANPMAVSARSPLVTTPTRRVESDVNVWSSAGWHRAHRGREIVRGALGHQDRP